MGWNTLSAAQKRETVIALRSQGLNTARIAERLGASSRHAVESVIRRAKASSQLPAAAAAAVRSGLWDRTAINKTARLWNKGWSTSRIAAELGVSRNAVVGIAARNRDLFPARSVAPGTRTAKPAPRQPEADIRPSDRKPQKEPAKQRKRSKTKVGQASQPIPPTTKPDGKNPVRSKDPTPRVDRQRPFEPIPGCKPVTLIDLGPTQCRWPVNGFDGVEPVFCGQFCERIETYCADHQRIACRRTDPPQTTVFNSNTRPDRVPAGRAASAGRR